MGDKVVCKAQAKACGLPLVPGTEYATDDVETAVEFAKEFGMPLMLKAAMGGGGRGMRVVKQQSEVAQAFARASSEAKNRVWRWTHVHRMARRGRAETSKFKLWLTASGTSFTWANAIAPSKEDTKKVVEMAPAPCLDEELRKRLHDDAVKLAKHVNYRNAGTVLFMVDNQNRHYFLEVNPRVQVEHTVTEEVTGVDIVQTQILIAGGKTLPELGFKSQDDVQIDGFAAQCRITTEDPAMGFSPDFGRIEVYRPPGGLGVRIDGEVVVGSRISPFYDSLLVKLTCTSQSFERCKKCTGPWLNFAFVA